MPGLPKKFSSKDLPLQLRFGQRRCTLRRLCPEDAPKVLDFFKSHSAETVRLRYGYPGYLMTENQSEHLAAVDQEKDQSLAIFEKDGDDNRIVAIGCYTLDQNATTGEMAFVVHEDRRCLGMASLLLNTLIVVARERKLKAFHAQTNADNFAMLGIFIKHGGRVRAIDGTDGIEVNLPLTEDAKK